MNELIKTNAQIDIYQPTAGTRAIDVRRQMKQMPELGAMPLKDKRVFEASTRKTIEETPDAELIGYVGQLFTRIAKDVGYNIPSGADWQYTQTRLLELLKIYYYNLSLYDIRLAFEMATMGELDAYLPRDSQGQPDRKHYQQFNADYFSKILNAYKKKRIDVIDSAYKLIPERSQAMTDKKEAYYLNLQRELNRLYFLRYKYKGEMFEGIIDEMFCYNWLLKIGYADYIEETENDRRQAYASFLQDVAKGIVNKYDEIKVRRKGTQSEKLNQTSFVFARKKEIKRAFDRMINDEIEINKFI